MRQPLLAVVGWEAAPLSIDLAFPPVLRAVCFLDHADAVALPE